MTSVIMDQLDPGVLNSDGDKIGLASLLSAGLSDGKLWAADVGRQKWTNESLYSQAGFMNSFQLHIRPYIHLQATHFFLTDILFLHAFYLYVEELKESLQEKSNWENLRADFQKKVQALKAAAEFWPEILPKLIQNIKQQALSLDSLHDQSGARDVDINLQFPSNMIDCHTLRQVDLASLNDASQNPSVSSECARSIRLMPEVGSEQRSTEDLISVTCPTSEATAESQLTSVRDLEIQGLIQGPNYPVDNKTANPPLARDRFVKSVTEICDLLDGILRPKEEQDLVGFGFAEVFGLRKEISKEAASERESVFYVTNRKSMGHFNGPGQFYGSEMNPYLNYGVSQVNCHGGMPQVKREHQEVGTMSEQLFKSEIAKAVASDSKQGVLLYVHGCFTDFARGMGYAAQISRGLNFEGPTVVFSWPTMGRPPLSAGLGAMTMYRHDEKTAVHSAQQLQEVLRMLTTEVGAKAIHIVAYSMGARTLLEALRTMGPTDLSPDSEMTSHIYFMAPDITAQAFANAVQEFKFHPPTTADVGNKQDVDVSDASIKENPGVSRSGRGGVHTIIPTHTSAAGEAGEVGSWEPALGIGARGEWPGRPDSAGVDTVSGLLEQLADASANIVGDTVSAIRVAKKVWHEGRTIGWGSVLKQMFGPEAFPTGAHAASGGGLRPNAHLHLYAAQNDIALLLSELMDVGIPQIRAGRRTPEFLLCNSSFHTIDASALKSGLLTTGHFYLFHRIVRADMRHMVDGNAELPWWRQMARWKKYDYFKLRMVQPDATNFRTRQPEACCNDSLQVSTNPLFWASP